ncbi:hypothetical protein [Mumia zhuanghuii]|uniref:hypothetical protein n=1 Tax=Mumia zhuanghuii TaxID=2585211 RepID=UPI00129CC28C|nr:hypothetical protein [Mumia zhuanghuii]
MRTELEERFAAGLGRWPPLHDTEVGMGLADELLDVRLLRLLGLWRRERALC